MNPLKFSIKVEAIDSYIYGGHLFLILLDGRIMYVEMSKIIRKLVVRYPEYENLLRLFFQRNDYLYNAQGKMILGIKEIKSTLITLWEKASENIEFSIDYEEDDFTTLADIPDMDVLDMKLYAMRMYLGCKKGLYEIKLNSNDNYHIYPGKADKRFDSKITHLNTKSGAIAISAGNEGLFYGSFLNVDDKLKVNEKPIAKKSIRTGWSGYDVINYEENDNFEYFVNETSKVENKVDFSRFDESSERKKITEFAKGKYNMEQIMIHSQLKAKDISYCFNSSSSCFFFTKEGSFVNINLNKEKDHLALRARIHLLPTLNDFLDKKYTKPISSAIIPKGCVVEYFDKVVLYQNSNAKIIETQPSISVRTYLNSIRYKNLITITKEDEVSIHSIYPFDEEIITFASDDINF